MPTVAVCVPTRGLIHAKVVEWLLTFDAKSFEPLFIFVAGLEMPECREVLVDKFLTTAADYLFFLDDDTLPQPDCIDQLLAIDKDIATGITWNKIADEHNRPMIGYQNPISGTIQWSMNWVHPDVFRIDGAGLSNCLIKRKVLETLTKPRFNWNWTYTAPDGGKTEIFQGEDIYFFMKAKEAGFEAWCNSAVQCQHIDVRTGLDYPSRELWDKFKRDKVAVKPAEVKQARVFTFDERTPLNRARVSEIMQGGDNVPN